MRVARLQIRNYQRRTVHSRQLLCQVLKESAAVLYPVTLIRADDTLRMADSAHARLGQHQDDQEGTLSALSSNNHLSKRLYGFLNASE
jgi:hypothetical protein